MGKHYLVQRDGASDVADILAQTQQYPLELSLDEVTVEIPGRPIEGENWAPQLAPFKPWVHDAALDEKDELDGTDGDLLIVGALGMGISDEERDALIGSAVRGKSRAAGECREEDPATAGMTPHQLWEAGLTPPWRGGATAQAAEAAGTTAGSAAKAVESRETLVSDRETIDSSRETLGNNRETSSEERFALNVPLTVREDGEGYAVSAVHLSVLAEHGLAADNLVVVVPSAIAGRPVVRIASEAFARRFTSGAQVRLLVVPNTVEVVGAQAFGSVCAEVIALGAAVNTYDPAPLDMALPAPRLAARRYVVHPDNKKFLVKDGCLLERLSGDTVDVADIAALPTRLLFAEAPYGEKVTLPAGVRIVGSAAFAKGCPPPRVLDAPASLERVDGTVAAETIWRSDDPAAMARIAARCGGRVTDFQAIDQEECWYGFSGGAVAAMSAPASEGKGPVTASAPDVRETHLVAGPPAPDSVSRRFSSAAHARVQGAAALSPREIAANAANAMVAPVSTADRLALPRAVGGAPLTAIAERALITAPATLVIPDTVRAIADGNAAKGTRKLMLPEGLQAIGAHCFCSRTLVGPVLVPASVTSIGEGSFEYAVVRLAAADAVVHITSDQLISCFLTDAPDGIPFDFERYDAQLLAGRGLPDHLGALLHRLAAPFRLEPALAARIVEALRDRAADAMAAVAREGDIALVRALADGGFLDDETLFERQIERLRASNRTDCVLYLMNWHRDRQEAARATAAAAKPQRSRDRFAL